MLLLFHQFYLSVWIEADGVFADALGRDSLEERFPLGLWEVAVEQ